MKDDWEERRESLELETEKNKEKFKMNRSFERNIVSFHVIVFNIVFSAKECKSSSKT